MAGTTFDPGTIIGGKYQILAPLGKGRFGVVFRVLHLERNEELALKLLDPEVAPDEEATRRVLLEVQGASVFAHHYAARLRGAGRAMEHGGLPYYTMELVVGQTLRQVLRTKGTLDPSRTIPLILQILEVLDEAHRAGMIHRDLKPENVMLTRNAQGLVEVRVLDLGIAKALSVGRSMTAGIPGTGMVVGALPYLSPEQVSGKKVDARADLYSVGVIAYECLSGKRPFEPDADAEDPEQSLLVKVVTGAPRDIMEVAPGTPPQLQLAIMCALNKKPEDRWASAAELRDTLVAIHRSGIALPAPWDPSRQTSHGMAIPKIDPDQPRKPPS